MRVSAFYGVVLALLTGPAFAQDVTFDIFGIQIYHATAYETGDIKRKRPARGSHAPGSFWFYNNWDFNALGTIYRQQTGEDIFQSFEKKIARPLDMDGRFLGAGWPLRYREILPASSLSLSGHFP
ncbi:serine hydrolase [Sinorhizobium meliloti]|uniref:serine hydrolase n=1 Tax=Rhizobium meliloti TaxID=382 RepID=UPI001F41248F|nr:serine hydrolase [Sinorhizobium meliloti]